MILVMAYNFTTSRSITVIAGTTDIALSMRDFIVSMPNLRFDGITYR